VNDEIDIEPREGEEFGDWLGRSMEALNPSDFATAYLGRDRPYNGQPHTDEGVRGATEVRGLTMRDVKDCFVIGAFESSGLPADEYPPNIYGLDWNHLDPMAVVQNMLCNVEKRMGIYPNVPPLTPTDPS
jgi:hypothetical protein